MKKLLHTVIIENEKKKRNTTFSPTYVQDKSMTILDTNSTDWNIYTT